MAGPAPLPAASARGSGSGNDDAPASLLQSLRSFYCCQVTQHGACLGLGLAALGSADEEVTEEVKNVLYTDSAVAGEAAGIALGLVNVGTASEKTQELLTYAHDTQHEKVRSRPHCGAPCKCSGGACGACRQAWSHNDISLHFCVKRLDVPLAYAELSLLHR